MTGKLDATFKEVVLETSLKLSKSGFKKSGNVFRLVAGENSAVIEFQKSRGNTSEILVFTINIAIVVGRLLNGEGENVQKARAIDGHLRERIGTLLPGQQDKWWEITQATDAKGLAAEVSTIASEVAVPYLLRYIDTSEVLALWRSGAAPGLTEGGRVRYLARLESAVGDVA